MKVGDLIKESEFPEVGLIVEIKDSEVHPYKVLCWDGKIVEFSKVYIESCEVVSEGR